jgi:hypothetical protein
LETAPQDNLESVIGALKTRSSSYLHNKYVFPYWGKHSRTLWSSGYFVVSTGGAPLDVIKKYIQNQQQVLNYIYQEPNPEDPSGIAALKLFIFLPLNIYNYKTTCQ